MWVSFSYICVYVADSYLDITSGSDQMDKGTGKEMSVGGGGQNSQG